MLPNTTRLVIFDLDGAIAHLPVSWTALKQELATLYPPRTFTPLTDCLRDVRQQEGTEAYEQCLAIITQYECAHLEKLVPVSEVCDFIRTHHARVQFAICSSNAHATIERALERLSLQKYFSAIIGCDDVLMHKPHPEGLLNILSILQMRPEEALYIGDRTIDVDAGTSAGIHTILYQSTYVTCR